jgi:hypothetical protein
MAPAVRDDVGANISSTAGRCRSLPGFHRLRAVLQHYHTFENRPADVAQTQHFSPLAVSSWRLNLMTGRCGALSEGGLSKGCRRSVAAACADCAAGADRAHNRLRAETGAGLRRTDWGVTFASIIESNGFRRAVRMTARPDRENRETGEITGEPNVRRRSRAPPQFGAKFAAVDRLRGTRASPMCRHRCWVGGNVKFGC